MKRLIDRNPDASKAEINALCWEQTRWKPDHMQSIFQYWFDNNYRGLTPATPTPEQRAVRAADAVAVAQRQRQIETEIEGRIQIRLLEMILPTGKALRESTREELIDLGGWARRVADQLQPGQTVADAGISEQRLRGLYEQPAP